MTFQRRGLWRLWLGLSVIWTAASAVFRLRQELRFLDIYHTYGEEGIGALTIILWPWIVTIVGVLGFWVAAGFRRDQSN